MTQSAVRKVTTLPATRNRFTSMPINVALLKRVAAYARVSTDSEEQYTSYLAQIDYYTKHIQSHDGWEFVGMYADEGISGTNTKGREQFNKMIEDALAGKIDLIITKSVSRFARNTVDSLTTVRLLKEKGVEVYFEKENIYTLDSKGELLITIMSSLAQEESRSMSENVTWGVRKRFADGKVSMPYKVFLGYRKGADGVPEIDEEQAKIVRRIYRMFLEGKTYTSIAKTLTDESVPTPAGRRKWSSTTVRSILTNEKYKGDALQQKTFCTDFLTKKKKVNEGEVPQYYVENSHPGIIDKEIFDWVQQEIAEREKEGKHPSGIDTFSNKLYCACCGSMFGSKVWHSNDKYRKVIWRCNSKYKNEIPCATSHVTEEEVQNAFIKAFNQMICCKPFVLEDTRVLIELFADSAAQKHERDELRSELELVVELMNQAINQNARQAQDQDSYNNYYDSLMQRYSNLQEKLQLVEADIASRRSKESALRSFMKEIKEESAPIHCFESTLWHSMIDRVTIDTEKKFRFRFKNGTEFVV